MPFDSIEYQRLGGHQSAKPTTILMLSWNIGTWCKVFRSYVYGPAVLGANGYGDERSTTVPFI